MDVLTAQIGADEPGCSAAVGDAGQVVWQGASGVADLTTGAKITPETVVDIGSTSKQFTATAVLLLVDAGRVGLDDRLSAHLKGFPAWSDKVTPAQLMHHTSGIPEYQQLLLDKGHEFTERTTQRQALRALAEVPRLRSAPGSTWEYSNSNYLLLGEVVREASGEALPHFLMVNVFDPLDLSMVVDPVRAGPNKATGYRYTSAGFEAVNLRWEQIGDGAIQTTPSELVRWADNYRTGKIGGEAWLGAVLADAVSTEMADGVRYGAGIHELADGSLAHSGIHGGYVTEFWISSDRRTSIALSCNRDGLDTLSIAETLVGIWSPEE